MTAYGWRWVFYSFALLGVVWAVAFAALYRNRPQEHPRVNAAELAYIRGGSAEAAVHSTEKQTVPWGRIFTSKNMWYIAAAYFCFFYGSYFYLTWFPTYLLEYRHLSLKAVGILASVPLVTAMIGDIVGGALTDTLYRRTKRLTFSRRVVAAPALLGAAVFLIPAATTSDAMTAIICLAASNFFLDMVLGPAWAVPMDVAGPSSGTVTGVMNMTGAVGASISPLVFGMLVQHGSWIAPFFVTAAVLVTGALIWIFLIDPEKSVVDRIRIASTKITMADQAQVEEFASIDTLPIVHIMWDHARNQTAEVLPHWPLCHITITRLTLRFVRLHPASLLVDGLFWPMGQS